MDIDLSTDLEASNALLDSSAHGSADICIGSRLAAASQLTKSALREVFSHVYHLIARIMLRYPVRDARCGFKTMSPHVVQTIVPVVADYGWFFDAELLLLAWRSDLGIQEIPVSWIEDDDSGVRIVSTAIDDLRSIWRLVRSEPNCRGDVPDRVREIEIVPLPSSQSSIVEPTSTQHVGEL